MMCVHSGAYGLYVAHDQRYPANRYLLLLPTYLAVDDDLQAPLLDDEHVLPLLPLENASVGANTKPQIRGATQHPFLSITQPTIHAATITTHYCSSSIISSVLTVTMPKAMVA